MFLHPLALVIVLLEFGLLALIVYAVLRGIRWAVAHGVRDAQKMAERGGLAATPATPAPTQAHDQLSADGTTLV